MTDSKSSYRQIIKSTSIFGGVQVFNMIISLIRSKIIAILIGPAGIGLIGLLNSALNLIASFTNAGIETSGVKAVSTVSHDVKLLAKEVSILNRLIWITGILGSVTVVVLSPLLSQVTFGSTDKTLSFILIAITLLFKQLTSGNLLVLQGLSKIKYLAQANFYGNLFGLLISVPLYYYLKIDGIIPSIVGSSLIAMLIALIFRQKIRIGSVALSNKEVFSEGRHLIILGFSLSFIGLLTTLSSYLLQVFISNFKNVTEVGFYTAGFTILNTYVGVIFTAMATDYYPRLAKICNDNSLVKKLVKEQSEIAILLLTPIVVLFLVFAPTVIKVLYSDEFLPIVPLVCWGILGMVIKAVSWSMGYILIAKGHSRIFVKTSIGFNTVFLIINILGFYYYGLEGLGITFLVNYLIHFIVLKMIVSKRYDFSFDAGFYRLFLYCLCICAAAFLCLSIDLVFLKYSLLSILILISLCFSWIQLNKRLHFKDFISGKNN
ncbi:O-antigen translocase [Flavobacterium wongokense]|uniref:O-antigen translocase n=1 Tax=Flavobacterium wongokense TaxID=2910674 RepID=UPI001F20004C|nr:O-antigen translocase [Flavobacterium sp. WG47]MCF6130695.1 O-antigen translocase [Flavobacterium sp. WG47]